MLIAIKIIITIMFVFVTIRGMREAFFHWDTIGATKNGALSFIKIGYKYSHFRPILIMIIPMIGVFINRKIGWVFIVSYFYFVLANAIYSTIKAMYDVGFGMMYFATAIILFIPFIFIMNLKKIRADIYEIEKSEQLKYNVITTVVGITLTLIIA